MQRFSFPELCIPCKAGAGSLSPFYSWGVSSPGPPSDRAGNGRSGRVEGWASPLDTASARPLLAAASSSGVRTPGRMVTSWRGVRKELQGQSESGKPAFQGGLKKLNLIPKKIKRGLAHGLQVPQRGGDFRDSQGLFNLTGKGRTRSSGWKLKLGKFRLEIRPDF